MNSGKLTVIVGPMFSGKTEELLRRVRISFVEIYALGRKKHQVFKPALDDRYDASRIVSHTQAKVDARAVRHPGEILALLRGDEKAVFVDEIQFLDLSLREVILTLIERGVNVYCSGLDLDFRNQPFPTTMALMAHADEVLKKRAVCHECGEYAGTLSHKLVQDQQVIDVGGDDKYIATCRTCYRRLHQAS